MSILLVEDETRLRQAIARSLSARGFSVDEAESCQDAISAATNGHYDLMLLDVNLPDNTGWHALRELAQSGRSLPTVIFSAVPPSASRVREFRPFAVLHKPFPMDALLRIVQRVAIGETVANGKPETRSVT